MNDYRILAPGLSGIVQETDELIVVATLVAIPEGQGACSRWLDSLPEDKAIIMLKVINLKLSGMLERRGFHAGEVLLAGVEPVPAYIRHPAVSSVNEQKSASGVAVQEKRG